MKAQGTNPAILNRMLNFLGVNTLLHTALWLTFAAHGAIEVDKQASVKDASTSVQGIHHIQLSVADLDTMLDFYQQATQFELVSRTPYKNNHALSTLYGAQNVEAEIAVLKAPNLQLELVALTRNKGKSQPRKPFKGPGMTHTCYQSTDEDSSYDKFVQAGADILSRGDTAVDLGGYGVKYAYGYDPEGNMFEMEQLSGEVLKRAGYDPNWVAQNHAMWMSQVALVTPDIDKLMGFYQQVLGFKPYRVGEYQGNAKMDEIVDFDNLHLKGGWFKMDGKSKVIEFWQFLNPQTPAPTKQSPVDLGYSFSLQVGDIKKEYLRLKHLGVHFFSEPQLIGHHWQVFARDIDGNLFALRQPLSSSD